MFTPVTPSFDLEKSVRMELANQRRRVDEDAARYNVLKAAIVSGDADALNELAESGQRFDEVLDEYGRKLISSYYERRKGA